MGSPIGQTSHVCMRQASWKLPPVRVGSWLRAGAPVGEIDAILLTFKIKI